MSKELNARSMSHPSSLLDHEVMCGKCFVPYAHIVSYMYNYEAEEKISPYFPSV